MHFHDPFGFTINTGNDTHRQWGDIAASPANTETWADESDVNSRFDRLNQRFVTGTGMPVLIGEYAVVARLSVDAAQEYRIGNDDRPASVCLFFP